MARSNVTVTVAMLGITVTRGEVLSSEKVVAVPNLDWALKTAAPGVRVAVTGPVPDP